MSAILQDPDTWEFLGLLIVIGIILWQRVPAMVAKTLDERAITIQNELTQAKQLREEAEAVLVRYTERAGRAQADADVILAQARAEAQRFAEDSGAQPRTRRRSGRRWSSAARARPRTASPAPKRRPWPSSVPWRPTPRSPRRA